MHGQRYDSRTMEQRNTTLFAHRHNPDGSWDTICPLCIVTVASEKTESKLATHESAHICDPVRLAQFAQKPILKDC